VGVVLIRKLKEIYRKKEAKQKKQNKSNLEHKVRKLK
jgi:hypothetical protein